MYVCVWHSSSSGRVVGRCNEIGKGNTRQEDKDFRNKSLRSVGQSICYIGLIAMKYKVLRQKMLSLQC